MALTKEEAEKILERLIVSCKEDLAKSDVPQRRVRSFISTGDWPLDSQLEDLITESIDLGIRMEVMMRARFAEVRDEMKLEVAPIVRCLEELIHQAFRAVSGNQESKNILVCLGYNVDGSYQIGLYHNGRAYFEQDIADARQRLRPLGLDVVLDNRAALAFSYTKGLHIVFPRVQS